MFAPLTALAYAQRVKRPEQSCVVFAERQQPFCVLQDQIYEIQDNLQKLRALKEFVESKTSSQGGPMHPKQLRRQSQELMETQRAL